MGHEIMRRLRCSSRCRSKPTLHERPRELCPLAVSCCAHRGDMWHVYQLHSILQLRRASAAQVWIASWQMFDDRAGFEVCAARMRTRRFHIHLADLCMCAIRVGRRKFCSQRRDVQSAAAQGFSAGVRVVSMLAGSDGDVREPHVGRSNPRTRPAASFCGLREAICGSAG